MGDEVVVLDLNSGTYYGLDELGTRIWTLIEQPMSLRTIREAIMSEYEVDGETCDQDILAFLNKMQAAGLVEVGDVSVG
jgi:coenzyme PQQ synthesis protein D (PqqD)